MATYKDKARHIVGSRLCQAVICQASTFKLLNMLSEMRSECPFEHQSEYTLRCWNEAITEAKEMIRFGHDPAWFCKRWDETLKLIKK